jgi:hypothetical protein
MNDDREIINALVKLHRDVRDRLRAQSFTQHHESGGRHRLVVLTGGRTNGELEMLGQRKTSANFLPMYKYAARAGTLYTQDRVYRDREWQTEQHDATEDEVIFDLANVQVGWMKFPKGAAPEMVLKPGHRRAPVCGSPGRFTLDRQDSRRPRRSERIALDFTRTLARHRQAA